MRQLDLFSALQSSTEGIATEFKLARGGMPGFLGDLFRHGHYPGRHDSGPGRNAHRLGVRGRADAAQLRTVLWGHLYDRHKINSNLQFNAKMGLLRRCTS